MGVGLNGGGWRGCGFRHKRRKLLRAVVEVFLLLGGIDVLESILQSSAHVLHEIRDAIAAEWVGGASMVQHDAPPGAEGLETAIDQEDDRGDGQDHGEGDVDGQAAEEAAGFAGDATVEGWEGGMFVGGCEGLSRVEDDVFVAGDGVEG